MADSIFQIGAEGVDTEAIVREVQETVARKMEEGVYDDARIARAERTNVADLRNHDAFLEFYMRCLTHAAHVDISDFEIRDRHGGLLGKGLVTMKTVIWKLLKFYTYRLWSQQNQVNSLFVTAIEGVDEKYRERIEKLEARVKELEGR